MPYRGHMPKPEPLAMRVAGHLVQGDDLAEFEVKLRRLCAALGFTATRDTCGSIVVTCGPGESVTFEAVEPSASD